MNSSAAIGIVSAIALFVPFAFVLICRLYSNRSFLALGLYYLIVCVVTLIKNNILTASHDFYQTLGILDNFLDAPLLLVFLMFFSTSVLMKKRLTICLLGFLVFESLVFSVFGFSVKAVKIILGPDIIAILTFGIIFFIRYVRQAITNSKSLGKAIMISALVSSYSIFCLCYIFFYLVKNTGYRHDAVLIYYLVTILSALLMAAGIIIENRRIKKLDDLKNTRKELASIYGHAKIVTINKKPSFLNPGSSS